MHLAVAEAARILEERGTLKRERGRNDHSARIVEHMETLLGMPVHADLADFYRERIDRIGEFESLMPGWNDWVGWGNDESSFLTRLLPAQAVPLFWDGCGSLFGLDLASGEATPAVYFFDLSDGYETAQYAVGSSLGVFMLLLSDHDRALREKWPPKWELAIDPDIDKCPRAPAIWAAG